MAANFLFFVKLFICDDIFSLTIINRNMKYDIINFIPDNDTAKIFVKSNNPFQNGGCLQTVDL